MTKHTAATDPRATAMVRDVFMAILAGFFIAMPCMSLFVSGPFQWHIMQPSAWQGGAEALLLLLCVFMACRTTRVAIKCALVIIPCMIYARRHGVDVAIILNGLYFHGLVSLGRWALTVSRVVVKKPQDEYCLSLSVGLLLWLLVIWSLSFIGFGQAIVIKLVALCVLGSASCVAGAPFLPSQVLSWLKARTTFSQFCVATVTTMFFVMFAKSSAVWVINHDSLWYGLHFEKFASGRQGVFEPNGLVAMVHYYPKAYETLLIPLTDLGSLSIPVGFAIYCWLALVTVVYSVLRTLTVNKQLSILVATSAAVTPALVHAAMTTKGDVLAATLIFSAVFFVSTYARTRERLRIAAGLAVAAIAPLVRLTVIPYACVTSVWLVTYWLKSLPSLRVRLCWRSVGLLAVACVVSCLVVWRTIAFTGVPFIAPGQLVKAAEHMGLTLDQYVATPRDTSGDKTLSATAAAWAYLVSPADLHIVTITWTGNAWCFLLCCASVGSKVPRKVFRGVRLLLATLAIVGVCILLSVPAQAGRGLDGNYFIVPVTSAFILGAVIVNRTYQRRTWVHKCSLCALIAFASAASFVTTDWGPGTRGVDLDFSRTPFELEARTRLLFADQNKSEMYDYFRKLPPSTRVIGLSTVGDGGLHIGWYLPVRYEPLEIIAWSRPDVLQSAERFVDFVRATRIELIILPTDTAVVASAPVVYEAVTDLVDGEAVSKEWENSEYIVWRIRRQYRPIGGKITMHVRGNVEMACVGGEECNDMESVMVEVKWHFPEEESGVIIYVQGRSETSPRPWESGGATGRLTTGRWMTEGARFIFVGQSSGETLAEAKVGRCIE